MRRGRRRRPSSFSHYILNTRLEPPRVGPRAVRARAISGKNASWGSHMRARSCRYTCIHCIGESIGPMDTQTGTSISQCAYLTTHRII